MGTHHTILVIWRKIKFEIWQILAICFMDLFFCKGQNLIKNLPKKNTNHNTNYKCQQHD
jgi:hypothetical protein